MTQLEDMALKYNVALPIVQDKCLIIYGEILDKTTPYKGPEWYLPEAIRRTEVVIRANYLR